MFIVFFDRLVDRATFFFLSVVRVLAQLGEDVEVANGMLFCIWTQKLYIFLLSFQRQRGCCSVWHCHRRRSANARLLQVNRYHVDVECVARFKCFRRYCEFGCLPIPVRCRHSSQHQPILPRRFTEVHSFFVFFSHSATAFGLNGYRRLLIPLAVLRILYSFGVTLRNACRCAAWR